MEKNSALQHVTSDYEKPVSDQERQMLSSSIRLKPQQEALFYRLKPILDQLREMIVGIFGCDVVDDLFGNVVPQVVFYPPERPDKYALTHPACFDVREIVDHIRFLTRPNDLVLDCMCGSGTSLVASYKTRRTGAGIELMDQWINLAKKRLSHLIGEPYEDGKYNLFLKQGDCRRVMSRMKPEIVDLGIFSPPYFDILSDPKNKRAQSRKKAGLPVSFGDSPNDLGRIHDYQGFMEQMGVIYSEYFRLLKKDKFLVSIVADIISEGRFIPYHVDTMRAAQGAGFTLRGIQVVMDHWKRKSIYGSSNPFFYNFHHHYALIFQKK